MLCIPSSLSAQACEVAYERTTTALPHVGGEMSRYVFLNRVYMKGKAIWRVKEGLNRRHGTSSLTVLEELWLCDEVDVVER